VGATLPSAAGSIGLAVSAILAGCTSTAITLTPSPQAPVCDRAAKALVLWAPQWRPDQKDVAERKVAAQAGLQDVLAHSGCFTHSDLQRVPDLPSSSIAAKAALATSQFNRVVVVAVRELGPVVRLLSSAALVDGGTEVVQHIAVYLAPEAAAPHEFTIHWQNGGRGVVKGVATLPVDMRAALVAAMQPGTAVS